VSRGVDGGVGEKGRRAEDELRALVATALRQAASVDPDRDAYVIFHAVVGSMTDFLVRQQEQSAHDIHHLAAFCVAGLGVSRGT
jgi:hypothetical protein